ncbi:hypothetical protein KKG52_00505, partial [Patescibacteria group bacterium]|nr:hypothetical protein [Patescibacteria group bacterium]
KIISLIPVVLFSFEKIFKNQLIYVPLLDIFQLFFLLVSFYFFILGITNRRKKFILFAFSNLFLGFFISTKFFITGLTVFGAYFLTLLINKDRRGIVYLITTTPIAIIVLLSSYLRVLAFGYSIRELIGIQKWVYLYHNSFLIFPFSIWPLLLFNKWYVWFGDKPIITDSQWSITWPILIIIYTGGLFLYFFRKIKIRKQELIFFVWPAVYLFFHSFGQAFSRYFVILIPVLYIVAIKVIIEIIKTSKTKK